MQAEWQLQQLGGGMQQLGGACSRAWVRSRVKDDSNTRRTLICISTASVGPGWQGMYCLHVGPRRGFTAPPPHPPTHSPASCHPPPSLPPPSHPRARPPSPPPRSSPAACATSAARRRHPRASLGCPTPWPTTGMWRSGWARPPAPPLPSPRLCGLCRWRSTSTAWTSPTLRHACRWVGVCVGGEGSGGERGMNVCMQVGEGESGRW